MTMDAQQFLRDVASHRMEVLLDSGVYRHLKFRNAPPNSWNAWFELVTWPGSLAIHGGIQGRKIAAYASVDYIGCFDCYGEAMKELQRREAATLARKPIELAPASTRDEVRMLFNAGASLEEYRAYKAQFGKEVA